jgi:stage V sporulation protein G
MEVTEVKVKLVDIKSERLKAFCTITMDGEFVIRDIKIIEGGSGPFVAMPSRKLAAKCSRCNTKNHLRAKFCNECGTKLPESKIPKDNAGRIKLHADIAHPINPECRERIQTAVVEAYNQEHERSKSPDYVPPSIDDFDEDFGEHHHHHDHHAETHHHEVKAD